MNDSATPVTAAAVRAALAKYEAASDELRRVLSPPPADADKLVWANAVLVGFGDLDCYPGPRADPDFPDRAWQHMRELAKRCEIDHDRAAFLDRSRLSLRDELKAKYADPALPTLARADFARTFRVPVRELGLHRGGEPTRHEAVVGAWDDLPPRHLARKFLTEEDCADVPEVGPALVLDFLPVGDEDRGKPADLWAVYAETRRVGRIFAVRRAQEERSRAYEEEANRGRAQAEAERLAQLEAEVASLRAARASAAV